MGPPSLGEPRRTPHAETNNKGGRGVLAVCSAPFLVRQFACLVAGAPRRAWTPPRGRRGLGVDCMHVYGSIQLLLSSVVGSHSKRLSHVPGHSDRALGLSRRATSARLWHANPWMLGKSWRAPAVRPGPPSRRRRVASYASRQPAGRPAFWPSARARQPASLPLNGRPVTTLARSPALPSF